MYFLDMFFRGSYLEKQGSHRGHREQILGNTWERQLLSWQVLLGTPHFSAVCFREEKRGSHGEHGEKLLANADFYIGMF